MVTRLDRAYEVEVHQLRLRVTNFAMRYWNSMGSWRDADIARLLATVTPQVQSGQQRIADLTDAYLTRVAQEQGFIVRGRPLRATTEALRGVSDETLYARPFATMHDTLSKGGTVTNAIAAGGDRLRSIVATNLQLAKTHAGRRAMQSGGVQMTERVPTGRENCALCVIASTQRYWASDLQPIHPGCVPAGSRVAARNVLAVSRRWYSGELTILTTAAGDEVSVTANHPVLTDQGWVPAHLVRVGDDLFRGSDRHGVVDGVPQEAQGPALIEDVWRAADMSRLIRVPLSTEDFHADSAEGEVEIVPTNSDLASVGDVTFGDPGGEAGFGFAHDGRVLLPVESVLGSFRVGDLASPCGLVSRSGLGGAFGGAHLCSTYGPGFGVTSDGFVALDEYSADHIATHLELGSDLVLGGASAVERGDFLGRQRGGNSLSRPRFDAPSVEFSPESATAYASAGSALRERLASDVESDRVIDIRRVDFSGHVYNLHTSEGWYSSDSHIVSNCDCGQRPYVGDPSQQIIHPDRLEMIHSTIESQFGSSDRGARLIDGKNSLSDYLDLISTREHGEIGPVLTWRDQHFTSASEIDAI